MAPFNQSIESLQLFGKLVKERRGFFNISQRELGAACGIEQSKISDIENGKMRDLKFSTLLRLAVALSIKVDLSAEQSPPAVKATADEAAAV